MKECKKRRIKSLKLSRIRLSNKYKHPHFDMTECISPLPYDFYQQRKLVVRYSDLELSSDAGILLARQAEEQEQICRGIS